MIAWPLGMLLFGLIAGSVLNCIVWRLPIMMRREAAGGAPDDGLPARFNLFVPRSCCPHCHRTVALYDNIPLLSWLLLRGRCRHCHHGIGWRYPLVELVTGLATGSIALLWPPGPEAALLALCSWLLIALLCIDLEHMLLPDVLTLSLLWLGLLANLHGAFVPLEDAVVGAVAGWLTLWLVYQTFLLLTGREGLGYGDFKLLAALGAWCGWAALPSLLLSASLLGIALMLGLRLTGRLASGEAFAFGPCLALAGWGIIVMPSLAG